MPDLNLDFSKYEEMDRQAEAQALQAQQAQEAEAAAKQAEAPKTEETASQGAVETAANQPAAEAAAAETKEEPAKEETKKDRHTEAFLELARRERALTNREKALKEKELAIQESHQSHKDFEDDPIGYAVSKSGKDFNTLVQRYLDKQEGKSSVSFEAKKVEDRLVQLEKQLKEKEEQSFKAQESQRWNQHLNNVVNYVQSKPDEYEVIISYPKRAIPLYTELLNQAREHAGRELDHDEVVLVLNRTEELLTTEVKPLYERLVTTKKFKPAAQENIKKTEPEKKQTTTQTLSNELAQSTTKVTPPAAGMTMSLAERIRQVSEKYDKQ